MTRIDLTTREWHIAPGDRIQSDGDGGWLAECCGTGDDEGERGE